MDLTPERRSMFQRATIQEKRSARSPIAALVERHRDHDRFDNHDGVDRRLLNLAGQKQGYRAIVVLIIGILMNEFMQTWTDDQNRCPLEQREQKQRDNLRSDAGGRIFSEARRLGFSLSVHETTPWSLR
jgi:hypothetical protein